MNVVNDKETLSVPFTICSKKIRKDDMCIYYYVSEFKLFDKEWFVHLDVVKGAIVSMSLELKQSNGTYLGFISMFSKGSYAFLVDNTPVRALRDLLYNNSKF